ncbi:Arabinanase/levansucrase/invertase [Auriculariales sp. MPI-PUGE-AT-0066]|nr:Arabinanase/levansucrase/invertase [Auriculariales sp. MPI-PUGE-AT-0066]
MLFSSLQFASVALFLAAAVNAAPYAAPQLASRGYAVSHGNKVPANLVDPSYRTGARISPGAKAHFRRQAKAVAAAAKHKRACNATTTPDEPTPVPTPEEPTPVPTPEEPAPVPTPDAPTVDPLPQFPATFNNPIKPGGAADPWVIYHQETDMYYLCQSQQGGIVVLPSRDLTAFPEEGPVVWSPPGDLKDLWAPELHFIDGVWYVYVAMDHGDNADHRMYFVGKVTTPDDNWAIDGTVFRYSPNGKLYFVWSGWIDGSHTITQNLYIAEMCSPTEVCSDRVLLHEPNQGWQKSGDSGVNEGPEIIEHNGRYFIVYSAAGSWTDDYCLAFMGIDGGADPMNGANWWRLDDRPVMWSNPDAGVWAPGHASFTTARDGTPYVVYHALDRSGAGWGGRTARTEAFGWNPDGSPGFPRPVGFNVSLPHPA